jgi:hypothetical protein
MLSENIQQIKQIREILVEYCKTPVYNIESNQETRVWIANVYMAVSLFELGLFVRRAISKEEEFYFSGSYFVGRFICDNQFQKLSKLYDEIIDQVKVFNYFRSSD